LKQLRDNIGGFLSAALMSVILVVAIFYVLSFGFSLIPDQAAVGRFQIAAASDIFVRVDTRTGETWHMQYGVWSPDPGSAVMQQKPTTFFGNTNKFIGGVLNKIFPAKQPAQ
jgi:hypothetical protein